MTTLTRPDSNSKGLVLLDRDGVLNSLVVDPEHGTIDSPLHVGEAEVFSWVPDAVLRLNRAGYGLCVVTNQPSAAKGKTTHANLMETHELILRKVQAAGGRILSSHICFHRREDGCHCRKPKTGMLEDIAARYNVNLQGVPAVGDSLRDLTSAAKAGAQPMLVLTGKGVKTQAAGGLPEGTLIYPDLAAAVATLV